MLLPYALASLLRKVGASEVGVTVAEAFVKLALFMGYMLLISRMKVNIGRIESGRHSISLTTLADLCDYYNVPLEDFFKKIVTR